MARVQQTKVKLDRDKIEELLKKKDMTCADLSLECGLSRSYITNVFGTGGEFLLQHAKLISFVLGCEMDDIRKVEVSSYNADPVGTEDAQKRLVQLVNGMVWFRKKCDENDQATKNVLNKFKELIEVVDGMTDRQIEIANRTILLKKKQEEHDEVLEKLSFALVEMTESLEYIKKRIPEEEPKIEVPAIEFAKAFIKSTLGTYDQVEENHICELAASYHIQRDVLKLAREELGYRVETVWGKGNKKVKVWRKPYGEE